MADHIDEEWPAFVCVCRAALEALLEPSEGMIDAATAVATWGYPLGSEWHPDKDFFEDQERAFKGAIQAALDGN